MEDSPSQPEIEFHAPAESERRAAPCPVCGETVGAAPSPCPRCETPHHFDCWDWNGGCGVYGCTAKPAPRPPPREANTVDLPAKLGMPHKRTGSYAGTWWVPPIPAAASVLCEFMAIGAFASGSLAAGFGWIGAMSVFLLWIAFSSVHYYVDFETMVLSKAKAFMGRDLLEWKIADLDAVETLSVRRLDGPFFEQVPGSIPTAQLATARYAVYAVFRSRWRPDLEIAPPMLFQDPTMREVADLFRRIEASGAFSVRMDHATRALPPPRENMLLLGASSVNDDVA